MYIPLLQVDAPVPGREIYWIAGLMVIAIGALFTALLKSNMSLSDAWKGIADKATSELSKTIDSLRTVTDAVEKRGSDTNALIEKNSAMILAIANEIHKISESQARVEQRIEQRLERLEERSRDNNR